MILGSLFKRFRDLSDTPAKLRGEVLEIKTGGKYIVKFKNGTMGEYSSNTAYVVGNTVFTVGDKIDSLAPINLDYAEIEV